MDEIHIVVCTKQVLDPEAPASSFKIDSEAKSISAQGVPPVINPYDESALELAIRMKEANPGVRISALGFGPKLAQPVMLKSLAVGADELYLIEEPSIEADGYVTAAILASALHKIGFDLVLAGRQAADTNSGGVGLALAELLDIPAISWARNIEIEGDRLKIERVIPDGYEVLYGSMPALITVSHEAGEMRLPKIADIRSAKTKPIHSWTMADLGMEKIPERTIECVHLQAPEMERHCHFIEGETPEEAGANLARILIEDSVLE